MKNILITLFFIFQITIFAQESFVLDTTDFVKRKSFLTEFDQSNLSLLENLETKHDRKIYKILRKNMEEFKKEFATEIIEKNFHFDEQLLGMANEILEEFKNKNPEVPKNTKILVSKNTSVNAYCLPDGTFVVNLGLYYWLENEDQVASVIAHEISHKILEHSIKTQLKRINDDINVTNVKQVREIKKQKFNKTEKALELFKKNLYATGEMRRKHEFEADSLGYLLLKKTKYNKLDYIETMKLMEKYDTIKPKGLSNAIYRKIFDLPNQPFKDDWLKMEDFSSYDYTLFKDKINKDSIASHPEIVERIKRLEKNFPELLESKSNIPNENYKKIKSIAYYNIIPNLIFSEDYGQSIYVCLNRIEREKDVELHKKQLGETFQKVYQARKDYKLNRYLDRVDSKNQSESYIQFLNFIWNLSLEEIKNIANFYTKK